MPSDSLGRRLKIASNRLPVSVSAQRTGDYAFKPSSGGLIAGLRGLGDVAEGYTWYGWPGAEIPEQKRHEVSKKLRDEHNAVPVFLDQSLADRYYDGFSNNTMWPLLHYDLNNMSPDEETSRAYREVNARFARVIAHDLKDRDLIWVQDYHLMLLPQLLREEANRRGISVRIGFFLHTPFPTGDFLIALPSKDQILAGVLASDVIGFHTEEYRSHFQNACAEILQLHLTDGKIKIENHEVMIKTLPIGIQPDEFRNRLKADEVQAHIKDIRSTFRDVQIMLGVDRLDYIKGIPLKLAAMDKFFQRHPEKIGKVVLIQIVIPSRESLEANQALRQEVQQQVGEINGKYGSVNYVPVRFLYKSVPPNELTALYAVADVCLICSTRDGLNLVCYEYVACHDHDEAYQIPPGILVLSKFVGASTTLKGFLEINPWDRGGCAEVIAQALAIAPEEARERMKKLKSEVHTRTSFRWAHAFIDSLDEREPDAVDESLLSK